MKQLMAICCVFDTAEGIPMGCMYSEHYVNLP